MTIDQDMKPHVMGLYAEPLTDFRRDMDEMIRLLMVNLTERGLETGTLTAKIKITLRTPQPGESRYTMMKIEPDIGIKIGAKGSKKCEVQDGILVQYDAKGMPVIAGNQISMDEYINGLEMEAN